MKRKSEVQELTAEEIDLVAGGTTSSDMLNAMYGIISSIMKTRSEMSATVVRDVRG